ncbi:hypothetical protein BU23DRAFT_564943 [Bimuria novae-zelandiae CBS 107.79]|uniref:Uncharacterized protein n=1 Tax=Bimuria novae-zelandiae CBS 107.79 TaxID=1447943 RepID=A0A6A5VII0_9PLEO|nr:hypothetical protein BU23DRAFT_564943 [Bimuria novae-zelandiae CBS 107.79]
MTIGSRSLACKRARNGWTGGLASLVASYKNIDGDKFKFFYPDQLPRANKDGSTVDRKDSDAGDSYADDPDDFLRKLYIYEHLHALEYPITENEFEDFDKESPALMRACQDRKIDESECTFGAIDKLFLYTIYTLATEPQCTGTKQMVYILIHGLDKYYETTLQNPNGQVVR